MAGEAAATGPLIWIMAGEASGDVLGGRLMDALHELRPDLRFRGIGGVRMTERGLTSLFPMRELAVMGLVEILPRIRSLSRRLDEAVRDIERSRPDLVVTIDSPGFALRLLKRIAALGIPRLHYVAPQVWAWREHRVREFPGRWERLLCLLPFEPEFFRRHGLEARFVGHPVLQSGADTGDGARFRQEHGLPADAPVLVLMPGSRRSEVPRLLPVFRRTVALLRERIPELQPVLVASPVVAQTVRRAVAGWPVAPIVVSEVAAKHDAFAAASAPGGGAALTKSGTSTLELALAGVPMAVTYRVNPLTATIARRLIRVPFVSMVNLLAKRALVPELLQGDCRPDRLAGTVELLIRDRAAADAQRAGFRAVMQSLSPDDVPPATGAAREVLRLLDERAA
ncbi:lipid-A-disaccharide synthase [Acetobacteraceae bacterium KSS8]|uniref:Lipid-A-disaccharide synthase n=1 Tax=Endosaccharibacter trunci TaxID=2812733 RepID=A0ABT1W957_9PROT|nr:lipid-A-disaccharide synthase [Acetobacteraceae bacterium KSS8]